MSTVAGATQK